MTAFVCCLSNLKEKRFFFMKTIQVENIAWHFGSGALPQTRRVMRRATHTLHESCLQIKRSMTLYILYSARVIKYISIIAVYLKTVHPISSHRQWLDVRLLPCQAEVSAFRLRKHTAQRTVRFSRVFTSTEIFEINA